jgi:hypothetical protein
VRKLKNPRPDREPSDRLPHLPSRPAVPRLTPRRVTAPRAARSHSSFSQSNVGAPSDV